MVTEYRLSLDHFVDLFHEFHGLRVALEPERNLAYAPAVFQEAVGVGLARISAPLGGRIEHGDWVPIAYNWVPIRAWNAVTCAQNDT